MRLTTILLPGNFERATVVPIDIPMNKLIRVADPDTWRERKVMFITSGSKVINNQKAFLRPSKISSMYLTPKNVIHCLPCGNRDPGICYYSEFRVKPGMTNKGKNS
jgi:hypothetical protein